VQIATSGNHLRIHPLCGLRVTSARRGRVL
jgi:hypothetical protein